MATRWRKGLTGLVAVLLFLSVLSACGGKEDSNEAKAGVKTSDGFAKGKFEPAVPITTMGCTNSAYKFKNGESLENNVHTKWAKENLGIEIKYNWVTAEDQCATKIRLALSSGEKLPDVMKVYDPNIINDLIEADKLMDITPYFDKYASDLVKKIYGQDPSYWYGVSRNGKKYGVPNLEVSLQNDPLMWIREDWLKQLNLKAPTTIEELEKVMDAFMKANLGQAKTPVGMALGIKNGYASWMSDASSIFGGYGAIPGYWNKWGGDKLAYGSIQPQTKEALAKLNEWFKKGYISPDSGLSDESKASELFTNESTGIIFGPTWMAGWPLNDVLKKNNPKAEYKAYTVPVGPSGKAGPHGSVIPNGALLVSKDFKHMDALMLYLNKMAAGVAAEKGDEFEYGWYENYDYAMINGKPSYKSEDVPGGQVYPEKYFLMNAPKDPYHDVEVHQKIANNEPITSPKDLMLVENIKTLPFESIRHEATLMVDKQKEFHIDNLYTGAATKTLVEKGEALNKLESETFLKIIYGQAPIDEFDNFVKKWNNLGGKELTKEVNEWYKSVGGK